jgi:methionine-rich copper-binding protein CopC
VVPATLILTQSGKRLLVTPRAPLIEGRYELQIGSALTDLLGNPVAGPTTFFFTVDTTAPQLISSTPANNDQNAPLTGNLVLQFSEPVFAPSTVTVAITLSGPTPTCSFFCSQDLPAVIRGNEVVASLPFSLQPNAYYTIRLAYSTFLLDASNNLAVRVSEIGFRAAPGP